MSRLAALPTLPMLKRTQCLEGLPHLPLGKTQVVMALKVEPEFGARAEEMTEAQRGIAGDGALAIQYSGNPIGRYVQLARELCRAHVERVQFLGEVLAGGDCDACHVFLLARLQPATSAGVRSYNPTFGPSRLTGLSGRTGGGSSAR